MGYVAPGAPAEVIFDPQFGPMSEPLTGRHWDATQMRGQIARRMRCYAQQGLKPGDRVLLLFGNRLEFFADLLAVWRLGCCAIPVDPGLTAFEIGKVAQSAATRFCVVPVGGRAGDPSAIGDPVILRADGQVLTRVDNHNASVQSEPEEVPLRAGLYQVRARGAKVGTVVVPVLIAPGQRTEVYLDAEGMPALRARALADPVRLADGRVVGERAVPAGTAPGP